MKELNDPLSCSSWLISYTFSLLIMKPYQCCQVSSPRSLEVVTLFVHTLSGSCIPISALVVPKFVTPIHNSVCACLKEIPYLKDLPLAHPVTSDENFEISVLIGADYYWKFVQDCIVRGEGLTAVQSHLSYLLPGPLQIVPLYGDSKPLHCYPIMHH